MAKSKTINLGELAIAIALNTKALQDGLNEVKVQLKKHSKDVQDTGKGYDALAVTAGFAFYKIANAIKGGLDAFSQSRNAMVGLKSEVDAQGKSFQEAQKFINKYIDDGLVPANNAATAFKNLLNRGYTNTQAEDVLTRLKDSAAFGKQASLSLGEAIQGATEGLKNENSILVDNAGVTKNVSVMWKEYAEIVGKSVNDLTKAEKIQAEYNGIMKETQSQVGNAAKYSQEFAGAQARSEAATLKLKQAWGAALVPAFNNALTAFTPLINALTKFVENNPNLVAAITLTATGFLGLITVMTSLRAAAALLGPALTTLNASLAGFLANPVAIALIAMAAAVGVVAYNVQRAKKIQDDYNSSIERHNALVRNGITKAQVASTQEEVDQLKKLSKQYDEANQKLKEYQAELSKPITDQNDKRLVYGDNETLSKMQYYQEQIEQVREKLKSLGADEQTVTKIIQQKEQAIKEANAVTLEEFNTTAKTIAQKRVAVLETQALIKAYKNAEKGSKEYHDAEKKLADLFPQFSSASGIAIDAIEALTNTQNEAAQAEWKLTQQKIKARAADLQNLKATVSAEITELKKVVALTSAYTGEDAIENQRVGAYYKNNLSASENKLKALENELKALDELGKASLDSIKGVGLADIGGAGSGTYENKVLENALKVMEHRKRLNQLSAEDEVATLQKILTQYAKTADEKMDIEERLYDARKALNDKYLKALEDGLADRTANSFDWMGQNNLSGNEQVAAYNRIIKYHKEYLDKVLKDEKISTEDKKRIQKDEESFIREQQEKIIGINKEYTEKAINQYIDAKKRQYDEEERLEDERLNKKLSAIDKEYNDRLSAMDAEARNSQLNSLYEQERKYQNAATEEGQNKLADIRRQIAELERESEKERLEKERDSKKESIQNEIDDNKTKYATLRTDLEKSQEEMLAASMKFAQQSQDEMVKANQSVSDALANIFQQFDARTNDLVTKGLERLRGMIASYKTTIDNIQLGNIALSTSGANGTSGGKTGAGNTYVLNDYGAKNINSKEDLTDYGNELMGALKNSSRGG